MNALVVLDGRGPTAMWKPNRVNQTLVKMAGHVQLSETVLHAAVLRDMWVQTVNVRYNTVLLYHSKQTW